MIRPKISEAIENKQGILSLTYWFTGEKFIFRFFLTFV